MMKIKISVLFLIIFACDFETPVDNNLLNLNKPINFFDINKIDLRIVRFPTNEDLINSVTWSIDNSIFEIAVKTEPSPIEDVFSTNLSYDIYMETTRYFSLIGVDSLIRVVDLEIINSNPHYDDTDRLELVLSELQYKTREDTNFQVAVSLDSLKNISFDMKFRYYFRITSGYNYPFGEIPGSTDFLNLARYRIKLKLLGYYLSGAK